MDGDDNYKKVTATMRREFKRLTNNRILFIYHLLDEINTTISDGITLEVWEKKQLSIFYYTCMQIVLEFNKRYPDKPIPVRISPNIFQEYNFEYESFWENNKITFFPDEYTISVEKISDFLNESGDETVNFINKKRTRNEIIGKKIDYEHPHLLTGNKTMKISGKTVGDVFYTIFKYKKNALGVWLFDEIIEDYLQDAGYNKKNLYDSLNRFNSKLEKKYGIKNFFVLTKKSFQINPEYKFFI